MKRHRLIRLTVMLCSMLSAAAAFAVTESPVGMWGMDAGNSMSVPPVGPTGDVALRWSAPAETWQGHALLDGEGRLFVPGVPRVFDAATGAVLLEDPTLDSPPMLALDNAGRRYQWEDGHMVCRRTATGEELFRSSVTAPNPPYRIKIGPDGGVYASGYYRTYAFSPDCSLRWQTDERATTPSLDAAGNLYLLDSDTLASLDADGHERWRVDRPYYYTPLSSDWPPIVGADGRIYVQGYERIDVYDSANGDLLHSIDTSARLAAVGPDGVVYVRRYGQLFAYDEYGLELWRYVDLKNRDLGPPVVDGEGNLYCAGSGWMVGIDPHGVMMWDLRLAAFNGEGGPPILGPDGALYTLMDRTLYAVATPPPPIPEPLTLAGAALGLSALCGYARRRGR